MAALDSLLRFHLATGVRIAIRAAVPLIGVSVLLLGLSPSPSASLTALTAQLSSAQGGSLAPTLLVAFCFGIAVWASPRVTLGLTGWLRHLPLDSSSLRRALAAALAVSQAPVSVTWVLLWFAAWIHGMRADTVRLAGLPVIHLGIATMLMPVHRRSLTVGAGAAAVLLALDASWSSLALSAVVIISGDLMAGPIVRRGKSRIPASWTSLSRTFFSFLLAVRAIGWRVSWAYSGPILCTDNPNHPPAGYRTDTGRTPTRMIRLPALKPKQALHALQRAGFFIHHTTGSHHALRHHEKSNVRNFESARVTGPP